MTRLTGGDRARMALRASLLQATWNYERQQGVGWAWCLEPALERTEPDRAERARRLAEHTAYFNTQPTLASVALGAVAALEEQRAAGAPIDDREIVAVKGVLGSALATIGDRLFWFTLRPWAACLGVIAALAGGWRGALVMWLCYNVVHLGIRWRGVTWGYHGGPGVLGQGLRRRLERLVNLLGATGAILTGVLMAMLLVPGGDPQSLQFEILMMTGLALGMLATFRARPTPTQWALGVGLIAAAAAWLR
jgi:PTS system mannose-specific IID component